MVPCRLEVMVSLQNEEKRSFKAAGREARVLQDLKDPKFKLYCHFLMSNIRLFDTFNLLLQRNEPVVHILRTKCIELLTDLFVKFISVDCFRKAVDILKIDFTKKENQKKDNELVIGTETSEYLTDLKEEEKSKFFDSVRSYYQESCSYILDKFPLTEQWLIHAEVVDINQRRAASFASVKYFIEKLSLECDVDLVEHQFLRYQVDTVNVKSVRIDEKWFELKDRYPLLSEIMLAVLTIPQGNADSERVFSAVRHVDTDFRQRMSNELMDALMVVKRHLVVRQEVCHNHKFTNEFLSRAKSATYQGLREAASKTGGDADIVGSDISGLVMQMLDFDSGTGMATDISRNMK